jgi:outer membrane usher protein
MRNSPLNNARKRRVLTLCVGTAMALVMTTEAVMAAQPGATAQVQDRRIRIEAPTNATGPLNPTGRAIDLTIPAKDGNVYLGDVLLRINADNSIEFSAQRILDLLSNVLDPTALKALQGSFAGRSTLTSSDFQASGVGVSYDPQTLELKLDISPERRASRSVNVSPMDRNSVGTFEKPAGFSAYVNVRSSLDYVHNGPGNGFGDPVFFLDGATRVGGVVLESEAFYQPGSLNPDFQRQGSRVVVDDTKNLMRWTAGDLQTVSRGFQSAPDCPSARRPQLPA